jgi:P-loop containing dynein motor region D4
LAGLYLKAGLKNVGIMFLMTDAQVANENFLVLINDMLASGEIPDLFPDDEVENIIAGVRNEVKGAGLLDTRENCWKFFIDRVRRQLKVYKQQYLKRAILTVLNFKHRLFCVFRRLAPRCECARENSQPSSIQRT